MRAFTHPAVLAAILAAGCGIPERNLLFPQAIDGVPGVVHLGTVEPFEPNGSDAVAENVIFGEVGPTGTTRFGGITFDFFGTGTDVCVWIDPELVSWSQSIQPTGPNPEYAFPDNIYDDGDLDLKAGLSVYYSGVPGETLGDFEIEFEDALGNVVPLELVECFIDSTRFSGNISSAAGRGMPEYCTISSTVQGLSYTVLMETYSTPIDDDRLSYGLVVAQGGCDDLISGFNSDARTPIAIDSDSVECLITGEAVIPGSETGTRAENRGLPAPSWIGNEVPTWGGSINIEEAFCFTGLGEYCRGEVRQVRRGELNCSWERPPGLDGYDRCYCGNELDTPGAGAN